MVASRGSEQRHLTQPEVKAIREPSQRCEKQGLQQSVRREGKLGEWEGSVSGRRSNVCKGKDE